MRASCYSGLNDPEQENTFSFTPIKAIKALPRLWERKPATPFQGGIKSRKLWKRFHASFSNMQSLQQSSALEQNAFQTAINSFTTASINPSLNPSKDTTFARGVKRLRVGSDGADDRKDIGFQQSGRSFLETKWEGEMRKRRELWSNAGLWSSLTVGYRQIARCAFQHFRREFAAQADSVFEPDWGARQCRRPVQWK